MSKIIAILLIIFTFHLSPVFPKVLATAACNAAGITYNPNAFPPNPPEIKLDFRINSDGVLQNLMGKEVRLHFHNQWLPDFYKTNSTTVTSGSFSITAEGIPVYYDTKSTGTHAAVLDVRRSNGSWQEECSGIIYTVGDPNTCVIDPTLPSRIPPDTKITIRFSGKPQKQYDLFTLIRGYNSSLTEATTDSNGQGQFKDVKIPGTSGDTVDLKIGDYYPASSSKSKIFCSKQITIGLNAPKPGPPGTEPVPTAAPGTTIGPGGQPVKSTGPSTVAGGQPCGVGDSGIKTAIGCIHTNPAEFAKDVLKFAIGISGGLAFLMMLVGAFQMLTSAGNPDSLKAGQDRLTSAVIGLLFVIFAVLFLQIIGANILGLPEFKP